MPPVLMPPHPVTWEETLVCRVQWLPYRLAIDLASSKSVTVNWQVHSHGAQDGGTLLEAYLSLSNNK